MHLLGKGRKEELPPTSWSKLKIELYIYSMEYMYRTKLICYFGLRRSRTGRSMFFYAAVKIMRFLNLVKYEAYNWTKLTCRLVKARAHGRTFQA